MFTFNKEKTSICVDFYRAQSTQQKAARSFNHREKVYWQKKITAQQIFFYVGLSKKKLESKTRRILCEKNCTQQH
jgi:hypothetical protein